jgi:hypothetical protein
VTRPNERVGVDGRLITQHQIGICRDAHEKTHSDIGNKEGGEGVTSFGAVEVMKSAERVGGSRRRQSS